QHLVLPAGRRHPAYQSRVLLSPRRRRLHAAPRLQRDQGRQQEVSRRLLVALASAVWGLSLLGMTVGFVLGRAVYDRGVVYGDPGPALPDLDGPLRAVN